MALAVVCQVNRGTLRYIRDFVETQQAAKVW